MAQASKWPRSRKKPDTEPSGPDEVRGDYCLAARRGPRVNHSARCGRHPKAAQGAGTVSA